MRLCWYSGRVPLSELPHGEVTIADLFRALLSIQDAVSVMGTKLEVATSQMSTQQVQVGEDIRDHEGRLRVLETTRAKLIGAATLGGVIAGALGGYVTSHLH